MVESSHNKKVGCARRTLSLLFDQREAVRNASPYSVSILAYGSKFVFNQGVLCYTSDDQIRILDVYHRSREERMINESFLKSRLTNGLSLPNTPVDLLRHTTLLSYADDILVFLCEVIAGQGAWLFALDVGDDETTRGSIGSCKRLRFRRRLVSKPKLFVRHNREFLYYGTHSALRGDGHHEWQIQGCNLNTGKTISPKPLKLTDFVGSEIGSTACFQIHDGHFYAFSNQTSFDTEEVDWTSSYHYVCFKLDDIAPDLKLRKIWRRQHHEGPINDSWTDLSLQTSEKNNELHIVECRKEWLGGGSSCSRTAYMSSFRDTTDEELDLLRPSFPAYDQLSRTLDECSKPEYTHNPPIRIPKHCHHEYGPNSTPKTNLEFIHAKTKFHTYINTAQAFVDIVANEIRIPNSTRSKDRLRLRVASRISKSPLVADSDHQRFRLRHKVTDHDGVSIEGSDEAFTDTSITLWPHADAPAELFELLCPGGRVGNVHAVADEHSIVYMAGAPNIQHSNQRAIIVISFDPGWGHSGLKRLQGGYQASRRSEGMELEIRQDIPFPRVEKSADDTHEIFTGNRTVEFRGPKRILEQDVAAESSSTASKKQRVEAGSASTAEPQGLIWTEQARYLAINQGYWLR